MLLYYCYYFLWYYRGLISFIHLFNRFDLVRSCNTVSSDDESLEKTAFGHCDQIMQKKELSPKSLFLNYLRSSVNTTCSWSALADTEPWQQRAVNDLSTAEQNVNSSSDIFLMYSNLQTRDLCEYTTESVCALSSELMPLEAAARWWSATSPHSLPKLHAHVYMLFLCCCYVTAGMCLGICIICMEEDVTSSLRQFSSHL